jgi:phage shock protein PspC (stress-responsive transcriptional regulator)
VAKDKPLRRSRKNRILLGVCGGFAEHYDKSAWHLRIVGMCLAFVAVFSNLFPALLIYFALWIFIPLEKKA